LLETATRFLLRCDDFICHFEKVRLPSIVFMHGCIEMGAAQFCASIT
jgi:hypothetical protein